MEVGIHEMIFARDVADTIVFMEGGCIREVAEQLGNTPAVCRSSYVYPGLLEAFLDPERRQELTGAAESVARKAGGRDQDESGLLAFLHGTRLKQGG